MWPPHVPISSHRLRIGRVLVAGFDRWPLALRKVRARRLRPAGRLTCRVQGRRRMSGVADASEEFEMAISRTVQGSGLSQMVEENASIS